MEYNSSTPILPAGQKPPLRIMIFPMGAMITADGVNGVAGFSGHSFREYCSYFSEFNHSFIWPNDGDLSLFGSKKNGTYTGVLGQIVENKGDAFLLPLPVLPIADGIIEVGPALISSGTAIVTVPYARDDGEDEIVNQLFHFKTEIVILLVVAVYCFALIMSKTESQINSATKPTAKFFEGLWKMVEVMMQHDNFDPSSLAGKLLFLLTTIGVMFWYILWENEMKSDMSTYDTSGIVQDIDDLVRSNLTIRMSSQDPSENLLASKARMDPQSKIAKLYRKIIFGNGDSMTGNDGQDVQQRMMSQMELAKPDNIKKMAFISTILILELFRSMVCLGVQEVSFLVITESYFDTPFCPWLNPRYPKEWKDILHRKFVIIREAGLAQYTWNEISKDSMEIEMLKEVKRNMPEKNATRQCIFFNLASYVDSLEHSDFIDLAVRHFKKAFRLLAGCCAVAIGVLILERQFAPKKKRFRKSRKVDVVDNSDDTLESERDQTTSPVDMNILRDIQEVVVEEPTDQETHEDQMRVVKKVSRKPLRVEVTTLVDVHVNNVGITALE